jgi:hypothetical protein
MKNAVLCDVAPCESCKKRRFGGTRLHLQGIKYESIFFYPEDGGDTFPRNVGSLQHSQEATAQMTAFFFNAGQFLE